jgi:hypothetical protein
LLLILAGWINRRRQEAIDYLLTEDRVLKEKLGKKRILLNDEQRRRLAVKGMILGRKMLEQLATFLTPETILRWHRELVARHWNYSEHRKSAGRPPVSPKVAELLVRIVKESPTWGYERIQGALCNLGHDISTTTVANILKAHGIESAPDRRRQSTWKSFLQAHWDVLASVDFTTIEVWTKSGLVTCYLLFVMELATRRVHFGGCTPNPDESWMCEAARLFRARNSLAYAEFRTMPSRAGRNGHTARGCGITAIFFSHSTRHSLLLKRLTSLCVFNRTAPSHGIGLSPAVRRSSAVTMGTACSFAATNCCLDGQDS